MQLSTAKHEYKIQRYPIGEYEWMVYDASSPYYKREVYRTHKVSEAMAIALDLVNKNGGRLEYVS